MSKTSNETTDRSPSKDGQTHELDLHTIARLTFRTSPVLFFGIIAAFVAGIGFPIQKYYELKGAITETNHRIELLQKHIEHNIELLKADQAAKPATTKPE